MKVKLNYELMYEVGEDMGFTKDSLGWIDFLKRIEDECGFVNVDKVIEGRLKVSRFIIRREWVKEWL
jgi:hypothetical protein